MLKRENCPITQEKAEVIFSRPYCSKNLESIEINPKLFSSLSKIDYEIRYSPKADLYFQTWVLEDDELGLLYTEPPHCQSFEEDIASQKLQCFAHQTEEVLVFRQLCKTPRPKVLDYGCNWGKWASMALALGCDVYGVEVNPHAQKFCSARGIKMIDAKEMEQIKFDFINCDQVLEHVSEPNELVNLFAKSLNRGGFLKLSTPKNEKLPHQLLKSQKNGSDAIVNKESLDSLYPLIHINLFSNHALKFTAQKNGLHLFTIPFFKWLGAGQLWNIPRQFNRNIFTPLKRWRCKGTYCWFRKKD